MPPVYATAAELKAEADVPDSLADAEANRLLMEAEDRVDSVLGPRGIDTATGRKIAVGQVEAWQWAKVKRATIRAAARAHLNPELGASAPPQKYKEVRGPDFTGILSDTPAASADFLGSDVMLTLRSSGLIITAAAWV